MSAPAIRKSHVGPANPNWRGGRYLNEKGYRRISWGRHRGKYEHRRVIEELLLKPLCADYVFPTPGIIPEGMHVEHVDHSRTHNCHGNLMLLQECIHNAITQAGVRYFREHYYSSLNEEPDWVTEEVACWTWRARREVHYFGSLASRIELNWQCAASRYRSRYDRFT